MLCRLAGNCTAQVLCYVGAAALSAKLPSSSNIAEGLGVGKDNGGGLREYPRS